MKILQRIRPEIFILILLIICVAITTSELQRDMAAGVSLDQLGNVAILNSQQDIRDCKAMGRDVLEYNPKSCKLIAIYDDSYNKVFSLSFTSDQVISDGVKEHILIDPYVYGKSGSKDINIGTSVYTLTFLWDTIKTGRFLLICVSTKHVSGSSMFSILVRYLTLILALTLFTNMIYWNSKDIARIYDNIHRQVKRIM